MNSVSHLMKCGMIRRQDAREAKKNCHLAPLTGGGTVTVTQWKTSIGEQRFLPPAPESKAKAKRS